VARHRRRHDPQADEQIKKGRTISDRPVLFQLVVSRFALPAFFDQSQSDQLSKIQIPRRLGAAGQLGIIPVGDEPFFFDDIQDQPMVVFQDLVRTNRFLLQLFFDPEELVNDAIGKIFQPGGEIDLVF